MSCGGIVNHWKSFLDNAFVEKVQNENENENENESTCSLLLGIPKYIYKELSQSICELSKKDECRSRIKCLAALIFIPVGTQDAINRAANDSFQEMRESKGIKQKLLRPIKTAALQTAALANYVWTVVVGVSPIPLYTLAGIIAALSTGVLKGLAKLSGSENINQAAEKTWGISQAAVGVAISQLYGVPRAAIGVFQKIGTLGLIPTYLAGRAIIDCKNAIQKCCSNESNDVLL